MACGPTSTPNTPAPTGNPDSGSSTTVTLPNGSKLVISLGNRYLEAKGQTIQLTATLTDASGAPLPLNTLKLLYISSRPQDISVTDQGLVSALVDQGFADITVMIEGTELKASQLVSVNSTESFAGGGGGGSTPQPTATPLEDLNVDVEFEGLGVGEFQVNTYTFSSQYQSAIAMDSDGDFVVSWGSNGQDAYQFDIYAQRYTSAGDALGAEFRVNTYTTNTQSTPAVAMDSDGDFVVTWQSYLQDGSVYDVYARRYNSAGTALNATEFRVNAFTTSSQSIPDIAMDSDGDFVITWQSIGQDGSFFGIYAQRYNSAGTALTASEFQVNSYTTDRQRNPSVAMDSDGDFVVTWQSSGQDGSNYGIYAQRYYGIYAQRYTSAGAAQDSEFQVNTYTTTVQSNPAVAMDSDGDFVVTWQSFAQDAAGYCIYGRRYNTSGVAQSSEFQVNTYTTANQRDSSVAMDSDGDFVVTWQNNGQDGSNYGIYAQRYTSAGAAQGSKFQVNTYTTNTQSTPAVAMDSDGDFVVTWESNNQDGSGYGIYGMRFNSLGEAQ